MWIAVSVQSKSKTTAVELLGKERSSEGVDASARHDEQAVA